MCPSAQVPSVQNKLTGQQECRRNLWNCSPTWRCRLGFTETESESCSVVSCSLWLQGLYNPWNSPGQNTGVGSLSLLQGIFPTQGLKPGLPHCRRILYQVSHKGSPGFIEVVHLSGEGWIGTKNALKTLRMFRSSRKRGSLFERKRIIKSPSGRHFA